MDLAVTQYIRTLILQWGRKHRRQFPFRRTKDPYRIIVSEVLLRRTMAHKVSEVYDRFFVTFPTLSTLATASVSKIQKTIKPLGIHRRAYDLKSLAKTIVTDFGGKIPLDYSKLLTLPGVGGYIAGCVIAVTNGIRMPLVDSNVARIFRRLFSLEQDVKETVFSDLYLELAPPSRVSNFHYSIIDLAHLVCTPVEPRCHICPLNGVCEFAQKSNQESVAGEISKAKTHSTSWTRRLRSSWGDSQQIRSQLGFNVCD